MGQNERNAKTGTSVESCSLLLQTSFRFTTDIFSAKSRVCICKHFVNKLPSPAVRRYNSFCFYGIAAAIGLRHTNGNIGVTISKARPERFSFSTLTTISKTLFGQFSENCFAGRKKNGLHCKPFIKKLRTSFLFQMILTKECRPCPAFGAVRSSQLVQ